MLVIAGAVRAQDRGGLFDDIFNRGEPPQSQNRTVVQNDEAGELSARVARLENALRQLTGTVEQLQHQNQLLQMQLQQLGARGAAPAAPPAGAPPVSAPPVAAPPAATPSTLPPVDRHSDAFDPTKNPNAPGAPRALNLEARGVAAPAAPPMPAAAEPAVGAPAGREAGAPLDLNSLATPAERNAPASPPPSPPTGVNLATLPPSPRPQDEYDMAYGYVLHKDYALAVQAFRDFIRRHPDERLVPDAQYWLGESLFQQQRYRDAAEAFLTVSTKYEHSAKAPEALLRLGQSLAAMHQKEAACATLAEVGRKYPRVPAGIKRSVAQEQKRAHC
ncbi:MAG: tol-pal system protein YbgF [Pseudolabrys sp.]|nr:tol-pal system protein YbgF [Pseudolabrys sp.]